MASKLTAPVLMLVTLATLLHSSAAQTKHVVGDSNGWTTPSGGAATFSSWAAKESFNVGDILEFNFVTGQHTVAIITKAGFDSCNFDDAAFTIITGPVNVVLNDTGDHYYVCTIANHCALGLKLAINVPASSSSSSSNTSHFPPPPPPPSTAVATPPSYSDTDTPDDAFDAPPPSPSCTVNVPPTPPGGGILPPPTPPTDPYQRAGATSLVAAAGLSASVALEVSIAAVFML